MLQGATAVARARPLARYRRFESVDLDDARQQVAQVYCPHHLSISGRDKRVDAWQNMARVDKLTVSAMGYGADVDIDPGELGHFFLLMLPYQGRADIRCGGARLTADAATASVLSPSEYSRMTWSADCQKLLVQIDRAALEEQLALMLDSRPRQPLVFEPAMRLEGRGGQWWRYVSLLVDELQGATAGSCHAGTLQQLERLLMVGLLEGHRNNYTEQLEPGVSRIAPRHVRLVENYIQAHADRPLTLENLVEVSGVSGRALFDGFHRFRGTSPMAYLRYVRMQRARADLLAARDGETVTDIASRWGFFQFGRFAVQYRQMFGEKPSETLRRR